MGVDYNNNGLYTKVKLADVITPSDGNLVIGDRWWIVTPDNCILLYGESAWQCSSKEDVCTMLLNKLYPGCHIEHFTFLYVPPC